MRCRFCGSKSLHEDVQHKTFSAGKAVAGAVAVGGIGAVAGFIGKDKKGYRCGACGQFMDSPMDFFTEVQVDSAIRDAEAGRSRALFDYYHNQYANIQANIPAALPASVSSPAQEIIYQPMIAAPLGTTLKRSYRYGFWDPTCPIWVEGVILKTAEGGDKLSLAAWNLGNGTIRSAYFLVKVFDDTGDQVSECRCVYQGLSIPSGGRLPEDKEFPLNTELAYRVDLTCEKAAFEGDEVWRQENSDNAVSLPEQPELSEDNFPRIKYADPKFSEQKTNSEHYKMPIHTDGFWLCCCGTPVQEDQLCPRCGDTWDHVERCFSQPYLIERQQNAVRERAEKRVAALGARLQRLQEQEAAGKNAIYNEASSLQNADKPQYLRAAAEKYGKIPGWRDADEQAKKCSARADEIEEKERAEEKARLERKAKEAAEKKRKRNKRLTLIIFAAFLIIAVIIAYIMYNNANKYKRADALLEAGEYKAAAEIFASLGNYKDSAERAKYDVPYLAALRYLDAADQNDTTESDVASSLPDELGKITGDIEVNKPEESKPEQEMYEAAEEPVEWAEEAAEEVAEEVAEEPAGEPAYSNELKLLTQDDVISRSEIQADPVVVLYHAADELLRMVNGYSDANEQLIRVEDGLARREEELVDAAFGVKYDEAESLLEAGEIDRAYAAFYSLGTFRDSEQRFEEIKGEKYNEAEALLEAGELNRAYEVFYSLGTFRDSEQRVEEIKKEYRVGALKNASVGDYITFGSYEQDNNIDNGKEDIEWLVLQEEDDKLLLISRYALDSKPYNSGTKKVTWEKCSLRTWLNENFISDAFSADEQAIIPTSIVMADKNPYYDTSAGIKTRDQVFLLSVSEAEQFFSNDDDRKCKPTAYTVAQGGKAYEKEGGSMYYFVAVDGNCYWWLRTPGRSQREVSGVDPDGSCIVFTGADFDYVAVRPAMWIDLGG